MDESKWQQIERRFADAAEDKFGVATAALTAPEARVILSMPSVDGLRKEIAAARRRAGISVRHRSVEDKESVESAPSDANTRGMSNAKISKIRPPARKAATISKRQQKSQAQPPESTGDTPVELTPYGLPKLTPAMVAAGQKALEAATPQQLKNFLGYRRNAVPTG